LQSDLIFKKLGVSPIVMSAGELESGNAGEPAKLIRQRYREVTPASFESLNLNPPNPNLKPRNPKPQT
jgi:hypothetical protein